MVLPAINSEAHCIFISPVLYGLSAQEMFLCISCNDMNTLIDSFHYSILVLFFILFSNTALKLSG